MNFISLGDLAQSFRLRQDNLNIRKEIDRLTSELATGRKSNLTSAVSGDFGALGAIENSLAKLDSYDLAAKEAVPVAQAVQRALEQIQTNSSELSGALLISQDGAMPTFSTSVASDARSRFESVVSALKTQVANRSLFSGATTDRVALVSSDQILSDIALAIATETTAAGISAEIDAYFGPGGGFELSGYLGDTAAAPATVVSDYDSVSQPVTALDPGIRQVLSAFSKAAVLDSTALSGNPTERANLARLAGEELLSSEATIVRLRAETGSREAAIQRAASRNQAERAALELARSDIVSADPFETATRLKSAESQMEALYTLTARLSGLSLTEYLR